MRLRRHHLWLVALLAFALAALPSIASSESLPVEAMNVGLYSHYWSNAQQTVIAGEKVTFRNNSNEVPHGLEFTGGGVSAAQICSGLPAGATKPTGEVNWHAECTFSKPGTYTFVCTVHPEMTGTITVTNPGEPTAITEAANQVSEQKAKLNGTVNPEGKETTYFFEWGTTETYGETTSPTQAGTGTEGVQASAMLEGLLPATTYHFRLVAKNEKGTAHGADQTFTTATPPGPPTATTGQATGVSETEATLKGTVNPDGKPTKYFFEWGTNSSYGQMTTEIPAGEDHTLHTASAGLTGLVPGTVYHFRLVAKNASEETRGIDQMFTTSSPLPSPSPPTPPTETTPTIVPVPPPIEPLVEPAPGSPLVGGPSLHASQRGSSVRGSLDVSQAGASGRLEVDLLAKSASLATARRSGAVRVGRLVRASVSAGRVSFSVALTARGKSALRRHHRLALTVKITLTPTRGAAVTVTRSVVLRA